MTWREYHQATKHSLESLRRQPHFLDWANMPDPFRHYEGVPVLDLPADPAAPGIPALDVLRGAPGAGTAADGPGFLSQLLFYSAAISAAKRVPSTGYKYALRVNPSSGNLHPTEFHFLTRGLRGWRDGLYHYRASSHMAEQRGLGDFTAKLHGVSSPVVFLLSSIAWREAWKYRQRAYRYCLHDIGHAWQSLALAARAIGCEAHAIGHFPDDAVARTCGLNGDEWPMLVVEIRGPAIPMGQSEVGEMKWLGGEPSRLSAQEIDYPLIGAMHAATKLDLELGSIPRLEPASAREPSGQPPGAVQLHVPAMPSPGFGEIARRRRSALDFEGGARTMSLEELVAILDAATKPLSADFATAPLVQLYLYIHRVQGLEQGVYRYWPDRPELELVKSGDQRVVAAGLSLQQELAGNACVAFSMIADLERAARAFGDRGYRYAHFEAGAIGQRMYLAAEAAGLQATGIGAFFDEEVHRYLDIKPPQGQVIYHFAIGYAVHDSRLDAADEP